MEKILSQLVEKVNEQVAKVNEYQEHLDAVKKSRMESEEKFALWEDWSNRHQEAEIVLRSLRQSLVAFRQAMGHSRIDVFYPERF